MSVFRSSGGLYCCFKMEMRWFGTYPKLRVLCNTANAWQMLPSWSIFWMSTRSLPWDRLGHAKTGCWHTDSILRLHTGKSPVMDPQLWTPRTRSDRQIRSCLIAKVISPLNSSSKTIKYFGRKQNIDPLLGLILTQFSTCWTLLTVRKAM